MPKQVNDRILTSWSGNIGSPDRGTPVGRRQVRDLLRSAPSHHHRRTAGRIPAPLHIVPQAHPRQTPRPGCGTVRNQMRAPLPQGDRADVDLASGLWHGGGDLRGEAWPMAVELGVTIQVLNDYRLLLHDSGVCMQ